MTGSSARGAAGGPSPGGGRGAESGPGTRLVLLDAGKGYRFPEEVVRSLRVGGIAIYPTDTLYGIGVDPLSERGLSRLFAVKRREPGKPIPLLLSGPEAVDRWARRIPHAAARLMKRYWPGPLTLVLPADPRVHPLVTGGGDTVGLRVPDHPVPRALAGALSGAVTGTSANRSGDPGVWRSAGEIVREFAGEVDWVLWEGPPEAGTRPAERGPFPGSTVVRLLADRPELLREGVLPFHEIEAFLKGG